jgi:hypothetical protein
MDLFTVILDLTFLFLTIALIPYAQNAQIASQTPSHLNIATSPHSTPISSPAPTPRVGSHTLPIPSITITPSHRPSNKRKSVSFSITSLDEIKLPIGKPHRPPTPFVMGPSSPEFATEVMSVAMPLTPLENCKTVVDSMGVQKGWLMAA